ncbi:MAG TPA: M55 family metallopeptidase [Solirubrobacteraceae bacterium]|nr:M55 family metallopeptidase [Solirubrobacteraceae bacterium]
MKVFISSDIEGAAGIVDWEQVRGPGAEYEIGRQLLTDEVNAAIDGAVQAGASDILVNDAHRTMYNLRPGELHHRASYLSGRHKPLYMMEGLDGTFDAVFMVAYHGAIGAERAILSHTYNPAAVWEARLNGVAAGESALNALVALHHHVPVVLITGDDATAEEARPFLPEVEAVVVKRSITRFAAESLHPDRACELIQAGAARALARAAATPPPAIDLPVTLEVTFLTSDMAEMASWIRGVERAGVRTVTVIDDDPLRLYRTFVTTIALTRSIVER